MDNKTNEEKAMRLVNGVITELLDPKVYYSRFSFLESGKEAIDKKHVINTKKTSNNLEKGSSKYYTRSALVKNVIPRPSDGQIRAIFKDEKQMIGGLNTFSFLQRNWVSSQRRPSPVDYIELSNGKEHK